MAEFTVRVLLHGATRADYFELAERLRRRGFGDLIRAADGTVFEMPPGEYDYKGDVAASQVCFVVKGIADSIRPDSQVLVTAAAERFWFLPPVQPVRRRA